MDASALLETISLLNNKTDDDWLSSLSTVDDVLMNLSNLTNWNNSAYLNDTLEGEIMSLLEEIKKQKEDIMIKEQEEILNRLVLKQIIIISSFNLPSVLDRNEIVYAIKDFDAHHDGELSLQDGDEIVLLYSGLMI